jgi:hypothetical protein
MVEESLKLLAVADQKSSMEGDNPTSKKKNLQVTQRRKVLGTVRGA